MTGNTSEIRLPAADKEVAESFVIMFVKYVFYSLWSLTVIGIAVKRYSYYLVPYIAAENPDMTARPGHHALPENDGRT